MLNRPTAIPAASEALPSLNISRLNRDSFPPRQEVPVSHLDTVTIVFLASCLVEAIARREQSSGATQRLADTKTWKAFKGHMDNSHLLALVAEDTAVRFPLPADPTAVAESESAPSFSKLSDPQVHAMLQQIGDALPLSSRDALARWGKRLDLRGYDVPRKIGASTRVLELPGTGGLLAARALEKTDDAYLHVNFTVLAADWKDRAMAGLVAMELDTPNTDFVVSDPELAWATHADRRRDYDLVLGLSQAHGGQWDEATLRERFPRADVALV